MLSLTYLTYVWQLLFQLFCNITAFGVKLRNCWERWNFSCFRYLFLFTTGTVQVRQCRLLPAPLPPLEWPSVRSTGSDVIATSTIRNRASDDGTDESGRKRAIRTI